MPRVTFQPAGTTVEVEPGVSLIDAARQAEVPIRNDCGGQGVCGRCLVEVRSGSVDVQRSRHQVPEGSALACRSTITEGDLEVYLPAATRELPVEISMRQTDASPDDYPAPGGMVEEVDVDLTPPSLDDNLADGARLTRHLWKWRDTDYHIPLGVLRDLPTRLRKVRWKPEVTLSVEPWGHRVLRVAARDQRPCCMMAVDIGTTTIKARLLAPGASWTASCYNSQTVFGPDIITRIMHCQREESNGTADLQKAVVADVNRLLAALLEKEGMPREDIWGVVVAANTTMVHLLLGMQPGWIRRDPYVGAAYYLPPIRPRDVGIDINPGGRIFCLPSVSSFVGADITSGVVATGIAESETPVALVDLGTNGEIAIGCRDFLMCCSASAGPAFEGAGSASGTRARDGAIESVWAEGGQVRWKTIGDAAPVGICGTGYIDLLATLVREGVMDKTGRLIAGRPGVVEEDGELRYVMVPADEAGEGREVGVTRADVENLIRAKGAIYAAGSVLLQSLGMDWPDLAAIKLAGGFGVSLDKDNAVAIGLLPDVPRERIEFVGNTSLQGAVMTAEDSGNYWKARDIAAKMTYFELSTHPDFMDQFVSACFLPHTDMQKFPSVTGDTE